MLMHVTTGLFLLRVIDKLMHIARHRPIAAGRVRGEPTARVHRKVHAFAPFALWSRVAWMTTAPWRLTQATWPAGLCRKALDRARAACGAPARGVPTLSSRCVALAPSGPPCERSSASTVPAS